MNATVNASWLVRLRWVAVLGQFATVACAAWWFDVPLAMVPLLGVIALTAATNAVAMYRWSTISDDQSDDEPTGPGETTLFVVMAFDVLALTALLYFAGGPENPFAVFYFVNLSLAAVILSARLAWSLVALAVLCLMGLFAYHVPLPALDEARPLLGIVPAVAPALRLQGLSLALIGCASVVVYFVTCVTGELRRREDELRRVAAERARSQRLESLATLAAGAGHELATPLGTIAVVAKELSRHLEGADVPDSVIEDVDLIRGELDHCRTILNRLSAGAGRAVGEELTTLHADQLVDEVLEGIRRSHRVTTTVSPGSGAASLRVPLQGVAQAIRGVIQNGLDATEPDGAVSVSIDAEDRWLQIRVTDKGPGMSPKVLAHAGDPFFTTKEPGQGMGLGLFLCRSVVERLGGSLSLESRPGHGVRAIIRLPREEG